jgi:hypothetical protein
MDALAGQLQGAVALLELAAQRQVAGGVPAALGLARALEALLRATGAAAGGGGDGGAQGWALGLQELLDMPPQEQVAALLAGSSAETLERDLRERCAGGLEQSSRGGWGQRVAAPCGTCRCLQRTPARQVAPSRVQLLIPPPSPRLAGSPPWWPR